MSDFVYLSLLAELILSLILIFIWLMQRREKHALYWGLGQISLGAKTLFWQAGTIVNSIPVRSELWILALLGGVAGYWAGSQFFLGRSALKIWHGLVLLGVGTLLYVIDRVNGPQIMANAGLAFLGIALIWCGYDISKAQHYYRIVGWVLMWRGLSQFAFLLALDSLPQWLPWLFLHAFFAKIISIFGLLYAVLHESHQRYRSALAMMNDGFLLVDSQGVVCQINPFLAKSLGHDNPEVLLGRSVVDVFPGVTEKRAKAMLAMCRDPKTSFPLVIEEDVLRCDGGRFPAELTIAPYRERGQLHLIAQIRDISERKRHEALLEHIATIDEVSGLLNRHALNELLSRLLAQQLTEKQACAVLFIDLDHFKRINDTLGHAMGDAMLCQVGIRLRSLLHDSDVLARFGGDEFVIAFAATTAEAARQYTESLSGQILSCFAEPFSIPHFSSVVTPSIGVAIAPEHGEDAEILLKNADIAMYAAKNAGRNTVRFFDEVMNQATCAAAQIDGELRHALARHEFFLVYQPIVDARTRQLEKVEALVRWQNAALGLVAPDRFIPLAEESWLIVELGEWILREACRQAGEWRDGPLSDAVISVNVSAWQLADAHFVDLVRECLSTSNLKPQRLELELTERVLIEEENSTRETLQALQEMGVGISLDDFGTGYSSLNYLTRFHLDTLKIDRSFVRDIEHNLRSLHLTQAIIAMGRSLEIELVAEGVETQEQANMLNDLGCRYLQGYYFSKPVAATELARIYRAN